MWSNKLEAIFNWPNITNDDGQTGGTSDCATCIWLTRPLWRSRFSLTMPVCFLVKLMSSRRRWLGATLWSSFSWARSSSPRATFSRRCSSAMSRRLASCSGATASSVWTTGSCETPEWGCRWHHPPLWTTWERSCCFHNDMPSTWLSNDRFLVLSWWSVSSAYWRSASSRSIRYMTSPRTLFTFFSSSVDAQVSAGIWKKNKSTVCASAFRQHSLHTVRRREHWLKNKVANYRVQININLVQNIG